jgi:hypothetical protein
MKTKQKERNKINRKVVILVPKKVKNEGNIPDENPTPKVRHAGHFLFLKTGELSFEKVDSFENPKALQKDIKRRVETLLDSEPVPDWYHFRGKFSKVEAKRIRSVKVTL